MALVVGGTTVTGAQTLDATKLTGNLPALDASSLTGITTAPTSITDGVAQAQGNNTATVTAPNPGVAFIWMNNTSAGSNTTIGSARNGGTATAYNAASDPIWARWIKISY